jgi:flagellar biosynthesis regulator FlaF
MSMHVRVILKASLIRLELWVIEETKEVNRHSFENWRHPD